MYRSRKTTKAYNPEASRQLYADEELACPFCRLDDRKVHYDGPGMMVVDNLFPYEYWDKHDVVEHLLLIPKRHVENLSDLPDREKIEAMDIMSQYEANGYSVYWRSKTNAERSVPHQHTHLIKVQGASPRLSIYSEKPYFVLNVK